MLFISIRKHEVDEGAETVEPILDSFGGYSKDNLSNFYYPYILFLLMIFRDEVRAFQIQYLVLVPLEFCPRRSLIVEW